MSKRKTAPSLFDNLDVFINERLDYRGLALEAFKGKHWAKGIAYAEKTDMSDADVQFYMGYCYENALGVGKNCDEAIKWYTRSAEQGHEVARRKLVELVVNGVENMPQNGEHRAMSTLKISKHSDVLTALDLVKEEVDKEAKRIFLAGGDALKAGRIKPAKEAIDYAEKLSGFVKKIQKLGDEWNKLEAKIDAAASEVRDIVRPRMVQRSQKTGFTRKVGKIAPKSSFTVTFPNGDVVADKKACNVFAKTIEKLGADKVSALEVMCGGEPLVTQDRSLYQKYPASVARIAGGWFVKTHSSTKAKIDFVKLIAKTLKTKLTIRGA